MANFPMSSLFFFEQPTGSERKQTTSMSFLIKKNLANVVSHPKLHAKFQARPMIDFDQRKELLFSKIDERNIEKRKLLAASGEKIAPFSTNTIKKCCLSTLSELTFQLQTQINFVLRISIYTKR